MFYKLWTIKESEYKTKTYLSELFKWGEERQTVQSMYYKRVTTDSTNHVLTRTREEYWPEDARFIFHVK